LLAAKLSRFLLRTDRHEPNGIAARRVVEAGLTQLRERFLKKRSTDVTEPYDECRIWNSERLDRGRDVVADFGSVNVFHACEIRGCER